MFFSGRHKEAEKERTEMKNATKAAGWMLALASFHGSVWAQEFVPFDKFLEKTQRARLADHASLAGTRVKDHPAYEEMRRHILAMYEGVAVKHSFVLGSSHFDCVPVEQQPAARTTRDRRIVPPQSMIARKPGTSLGAVDAGQPRAKAVDAFGNVAGCERETIPMRRVTLDEVSRFSSLAEFFGKAPVAARDAYSPEAPAAADPTLNHKYAIMHQTVPNIGGSSALNTWTPTLNPAKGEVMSLSQQWYRGGTGAATQTAEVGWQVQPAYWKTNDAVLFVYWTANGYDAAQYPGIKGAGCYNLSCGAFYQVDNEAVLGAPLTSSIPGGDQYEFIAQFYLYKGDWWLAINGTWIGYYPGSLYHGGQMTRNAEAVEFGTETYATSGVWPVAGSGQWANGGWTNAAYQADVFYFSVGDEPTWAALTPYQPSPKCYSTSGPFTADNGSVFFYAGGPGGPGC